MNKAKFLRYWSVVVGAMDALTGVLLILAPGPVLGLLGVAPPPPEALVYVSWVGVFVMAVGLSYAMALGRRGRGEAVWGFTAMVRMLVAVFLTIQILTNTLVPAWALVGAADAFVAVVQIVILRKGWWREVAK
jgi:Na+-driven multidrug efflux pump